MRDIGPGCGIIHSIRQVAHQYTTHTPPGKLTDPKGPVQDAHVGMHTHKENRVDMVLPEHVVDLRTAIGDYIARANGEKWSLPAPGAVVFVSRSITATVTGVDGQRRVLQRQLLWRFEMRGVFSQPPAGRVRVKTHRVGGRMDDEDPGCARLLQQRLHLARNLTDPDGRPSAPVPIPHVGYDDCHVRG